MIEQLKTIREFFDGISVPYETLIAFEQLEAMVGEQEPVAWAVYWGLPPTRQNSVHFDKESAQAVANQIKSATEVRPLYAAPVAQQPQAKPHKPLFADLIAQHPGLREELLEMDKQPQDRPDFTDEWAGYLKDGETPFERFLRERKDVQSALKLYQRALEENERLKAQQPQAGAASSDHPLYVFATEVIHGAYRYTELPAKAKAAIAAARAQPTQAVLEKCGIIKE